MKIIDKRNSLRKHPAKRYSTRSRSQIKYIAIHHSASTSGTVEGFANYHVNSLGWAGIGYHYVIDKQGVIHWCNNVETISYHVGNSNSVAVGICMIGDFTKEKPTDAQYKATLQLTKKLMSELNISVNNVKGHKEFPNNYTACPAIDMNKFRKDVNNSSSQYTEAKVTYNGKSVKSLLINGSNHVQLRDLANVLGVQIGYDSKTKQVTFNNKVVKPVIIDGRSYLPIREAIGLIGNGLKVRWDSKTQTAIVYK